MTNLFEVAQGLKQVVDSKSRKGLSVSRDKIKLPYFRGNFRSEKSGTFSLDLKTVKIKGKRTKKVTVTGSNVTGAFLISYFSCLAYCIVQCENQYRHANNYFSFDAEKKAIVPFTTYLIEALLSQEGYSFADYKQGSITGAKRIENHIVAIAKREKLAFAINESIITGFTPVIVNNVLSAV